MSITEKTNNLHREIERSKKRRSEYMVAWLMYPEFREYLEMMIDAKTIRINYYKERVSKIEHNGKSTA